MRAWNTGSIKQSKAKIEKQYIKEIETDEGVIYILKEALKISPKFAIRFVTHLRALEEFYSKYKSHLKMKLYKEPKIYFNNSLAYMCYIQSFLLYTSQLPPGDVPKHEKEFLYSSLFFKPPSQSMLINYLSNKTNNQYSLHEAIIRHLKLTDYPALEFYLPQIFQCLRTNTNNQVYKFLIHIGKRCIPLSHQILWLCRVEKKVDPHSKRKVPLPTPTDELPKIVEKLMNELMRKLSSECLRKYHDETDFFDKITSISSVLKVKEQSKAEKRAIIKEYLEKYNKELLAMKNKENIYLPTNFFHKVMKNNLLYYK